MKGDELRKIRTRLYMTQTELADALGVTRNTVARWERNEVSIREPMARLIKVVAKKGRQP